MGIIADMKADYMEKNPKKISHPFQVWIVNKDLLARGEGEWGMSKSFMDLDLAFKHFEQTKKDWSFSLNIQLREYFKEGYFNLIISN